MLFSSIVYGPIRSRRLGVSLGINLMPTDCKICTFDCVYCECGFNTAVLHPCMPTREQVKKELEQTLSSLTTPLDVITFSGNGEPTLSPDFIGIIQDTCTLRDHYCPNAKISVLSNSTQLFRPDVVKALMLCDNRILKLDSAIDVTMRLIDRPVNPQLTVSEIEQRLQSFHGDFILQTCFLRGEHKGKIIDNTTPEELQAWYAAVERLNPKQIMIYVIDRATPVKTLEKISPAQMQQIAAPLLEKGRDVIVCS